MISPLFTTIVVVSAFIWIYMKITTKRLGSGNEAFLERESLANSTRRQSLDSLDYISFSENDYPVIIPSPNERIALLYESLSELSSQKIVNLTGITNTELKLNYGAANLPLLSEYDQNFTKLARTIYDLGTELEACGLVEEAIKAYKFGISIGTDISGNYIALANIYVEGKNYGDINFLIAAASSIRSLTKNSTIKKLQEILDSNTTMVLPRDNSDAKKPSSDSCDNILPADILDILETVPYKSNDQK